MAAAAILEDIIESEHLCEYMLEDMKIEGRKGGKNLNLRRFELDFLSMERNETKWPYKRTMKR